MSTPKDLNNSVVIPARNVREYSASSLTKRNILNKVDVVNDDFLRSSTKIQPYYFAEAQNIAGEEGADYKNIYTDSTDKGWTSSNGYDQTTTETILTASQTNNAEYIYVTARFRFYGNEQLDPIIGVTQSIDIVVDQKMRNGSEISKSRTVQWTQGSLERATRVSLTLRYSNGVLYAEQTKATFGNYGREPLFGEILIQEILLDNRANDENLIFGSKYTYTIGETNFGLLDDNEIFIVEGQATSVMTAKGSCLLDDGTSEEQNFDVVIMPQTYNKFSDFRNDCKTYFANNPSALAIIGIRQNNYKPATNQRFFRFDKNFTVYTCNATSTSDMVNIVNFEISIKVQRGIAYYKEKLLYSLGEANDDASQFSVQGNSLFQEDTVGSGVSSYGFVSDSIIKKFKNGRNTTNVSVFYDKYLDLNGSPVYNGADGYFIKTDDIVTPYTIRASKNMNDFLEVPLYTDGYSVDNEGKQVAVGKQFYVTSCSFEYDGDFAIDLACIEKID